jgi:hypothetical protein
LLDLIHYIYDVSLPAARLVIEDEIITNPKNLLSRGPIFAQSL